MRFVKDVGAEEISFREKELFSLARDRLSDIKSTRIYLPETEGAILSFNLEGRSPDKVGRLLDEKGICVRSGYHCSALGHKTLGTYGQGTVRVSFGAFNDRDDVDALCREIKEIVREI